MRNCSLTHPLHPQSLPCRTARVAPPPIAAAPSTRYASLKMPQTARPKQFAFGRANDPPAEASACPLTPPGSEQALLQKQHPVSTHEMPPAEEGNEAPPEPRCKKAKTQQPRLFLHLFAGVHSPLSKATHALQCDYFTPFDLARHPSHDILDDRVMHLLQRLAFSGLVGVIWSAPPCKEFSEAATPRAQASSHAPAYEWPSFKQPGRASTG